MFSYNYHLICSRIHYKSSSPCEYLFACNGECPKNRFLYTQEGEPGLNYLCAGYRKFFQHVAPFMDFMKRELQAQRPPANIMQHIKKVDGQLVVEA